MKTLRMRTRYDETIVSPSVEVPREEPENQLGRGINRSFFIFWFAAKRTKAWRIME